MGEKGFPPPEDQLIAELVAVRDTGLLRLRSLSLPALLQVARRITLDESSTDHVVIEGALRRAILRFRGGRYGDALTALYGLDAGTRGDSSRVRRERAAAAFERTFETFRKNYEPVLIAELATQLLILFSEQHTRERRDELEPVDSPTASAMAVKWLEQFQAYYRMWTPIYALGADLTAYRLTLLEPKRPYDRPSGTNGAGDPGYTQEQQAAGYAAQALYHWTSFELSLRRFVVEFGGLWVLADAEAEQTLSNDVMLINWYVEPFNEKDEAFLRRKLADTKHEEMDEFLEALLADEVGRELYDEWMTWVASCKCHWQAGLFAEHEYFPTARYHSGISGTCHVHQVVEACGEYCDTLDTDWRRVADWYRVGEPPPSRRLSAHDLYEEWQHAKSR